MSLGNQGQSFCDRYPCCTKWPAAHMWRTLYYLLPPLATLSSKGKRGKGIIKLSSQDAQHLNRRFSRENGIARACASVPEMVLQETS